ncbi:LexA family protein [Enterococcus sp. LJL90]
MDNLERNKIIAANIKSFLHDRNTTQKALALAIGISPSTMSDYMNLRSNPSHGVIQKIADYFNVGKSDIDTTYKEIDDITFIYNQLEPPRQAKVYSFAEAQLKQQNNKVVPLYGTTAANPTELAYGDIDLDTTVETSVPDKADCALVVKGNSMEPEYQDGDIVFYKAQPTVENGEMAIVEIEGTGVTLKKVYMNYDDNMVILRSLNGDYDDRELEPEKVRILGKVVK